MDGTKIHSNMQETYPKQQNTCQTKQGTTSLQNITRKGHIEIESPMVSL